jgi:hypothetical protein
MPSSKTYAVYWLAPGCHFETACSGSGAPNSTDTNYERVVNSYFQKVGNTSFYDILTQYSVSSPTPYTIANSSTFGGSCVDTTPYASVGGGHHGTPGDPLLDSDIEAELANAISVCNLGNPDTMSSPTVEFFIYTGLDVESCFDSSHNDCSATDTNGNADYCAYHSYSNLPGVGINAIYANMPDMSSRCNSGSSPNGDSYADNLINLTSHEHFESVSDPYLNAWYDSNQQEIGDKCVWQFGVRPSDVTLNGSGFYLQEEFSNGSSSVVPPAPCSNETLSANPSTSQVSLGSSVTFTISARCGGIPMYAWWLATISNGTTTWKQLAPYATSNTYTWDTTGLATGSYAVVVWAENWGAPVTTFDTYALLGMAVVPQIPCSNPTLTNNPSSSQVPLGSSVTFTINASCGGTPMYAWWLATISNGTTTWKQLAPYATSNTYTWDTTGLATGSYAVFVWAENWGAPVTTFDTYSARPFALSP